MINLYTLATPVKSVANALSVHQTESFGHFYQARPGMYLPVILSEDGKLHLTGAGWGCIPPGHISSLLLFPLEKTLRQAPFNRWIHTQRCLIPANCFFARHPAEDDIYLIRILEHRMFLMAGMYCYVSGSAGQQVCQFILLTTESADVLRTLTPEMPVILRPEEALRWLDDQHLIDLMQQADRAGDYWFDYFPVSPEIIIPGNNNRALLKPLGLSRQQIAERENVLKAVDFRQDRYDRKGSKR